MSGFTDLHLHLLPGVDDGPRDEQESIALARQLVDDGIRRCVVTPHFNAWNPGVLLTKSDVEGRVQMLQSVLRQEDIDLEVFSGAEHFLTPEMVQMVRDGTAPTLGPGPYILVEFPFDTRPLYVEDLLYQLGLAGVSPVLAHPARYSWVQADPLKLEPFFQSGTALQATAASLNGHYGPRVQRTAEFILRQGWYSLAGTDLHHPGQSRSLTVMADQVEKIVGEAGRDILFFQNPARVLSGDPLIPMAPSEAPPTVKKRFGLFR